MVQFLNLPREKRARLIAFFEKLVLEVESRSPVVDWQDCLSAEFKVKLFVNPSGPAGQRPPITYSHDMQGFLLFVCNIWTHRAFFGWERDVEMLQCLYTWYPWFIPSFAVLMLRANRQALAEVPSAGTFFDIMCSAFNTKAETKKQFLNAQQL